MIKIKQAVKCGYIEMVSGGIADVTFPTSKIRRGRVQGNPPGQICPALMAHNFNGLVIIKFKEEVLNDARTTGIS